MLPVFGIILSILITEVTTCHFVCKVLKTYSFNSHYHAYHVKQVAERPVPIMICGQENFLDHHIPSLYSVSDFDLTSEVPPTRILIAVQYIQLVFEPFHDYSPYLHQVGHSHNVMVGLSRQLHNGVTSH